MVISFTVVGVILLLFVSLFPVVGSQTVKNSVHGNPSSSPFSEQVNSQTAAVSESGLTFTMIKDNSFHFPWMGAVNLWNGKIYIVNEGGSTLSDTTLSIIDPTNNNVSTFLSIPTYSGGLAFSRSGQVMYLLTSGKHGYHHLSIYNLTNSSLVANVSVPANSFFVVCNQINSDVLVTNLGSLIIVSGENYSTRSISYVNASYLTNEQVVFDQNSNRLFLVTDREIVIINASTYKEEGNITNSTVGRNVTFMYAAVNEAQNLIYVYGIYNNVSGVYVAAYNLTSLKPVWFLYRNAFGGSILPYFSPSIIYDSRNNAVFLLTNGPFNYYNAPVLVELNGSTGHIVSVVARIPFNYSLTPDGLLYDSANGVTYIFMDDEYNVHLGNVVAVTVSGNGTYGPSSSDLALAQILKYVGGGLTAIVVLAAVWIPYLYVESRNLRKK